MERDEVDRILRDYAKKHGPMERGPDETRSREQIAEQIKATGSPRWEDPALQAFTGTTAVEIDGAASPIEV